MKLGDAKRDHSLSDNAKYSLSIVVDGLNESKKGILSPQYKSDLSEEIGLILKHILTEPVELLDVKIALLKAECLQEIITNDQHKALLNLFEESIPGFRGLKI